MIGSRWIKIKKKKKNETLSKYGQDQKFETTPCALECWALWVIESLILTWHGSSIGSRMIWGSILKFRNATPDLWYHRWLDKMEKLTQKENKNSLSMTAQGEILKRSDFSKTQIFSPNSNEKNSLIDTRSPIEIVISELEAVTSCDPSRKKVATLVSKLSRRLENFKRKRFNSETSDLSATRWEKKSAKI